MAARSGPVVIRVRTVTGIVFVAVAAVEDDRLRPCRRAAGARRREVRGLGRAGADGQVERRDRAARPVRPGVGLPLDRPARPDAARRVPSLGEEDGGPGSGLRVGHLDVGEVGEALRQRVARVGAARVVERDVEQRGLAGERVGRPRSSAATSSRCRHREGLLLVDLGHAAPDLERVGRRRPARDRGRGPGVEAERAGLAMRLWVSALVERWTVSGMVDRVGDA